MRSSTSGHDAHWVLCWCPLSCGEVQSYSFLWRHKQSLWLLRWYGSAHSSMPTGPPSRKELRTELWGSSEALGGLLLLRVLKPLTGMMSVTTQKGTDPAGLTPPHPRWRLGSHPVGLY